MNKYTLYIEKTLEQLLVFLPKLIIGCMLLCVFWLIGTFFQRLVLKFPTKDIPQDIYVYRIIGKALKILMIIIGVITALGSVGMHIGALLGSLGLTGFAIGFAMKDIISNFLAGVLVLIYKPIRIGNYVEIDKFTGNVISIDLKYTILENNDRLILIPNSKVFSSAVSIERNKK